MQVSINLSKHFCNSVDSWGWIKKSPQRYSYLAIKLQNSTNDKRDGGFLDYGKTTLYDYFINIVADFYL